MALAPTAAASPASADSAPPPDDMSADAEAPEATEPECIATICRKPDGTFVLYAGEAGGSRRGSRTRGRRRAGGRGPDLRHAPGPSPRRHGVAEQQRRRRR